METLTTIWFMILWLFWWACFPRVTIIVIMSMTTWWEWWMTLLILIWFIVDVIGMPSFEQHEKGELLK